MDENPVRREEFEATARQIAAAIESGAEVADITIAEDQFSLSHKEEGGFGITSSDGSAASDLFEPAESRPAGYPEDLPFIAGEAVTLSRTGGGRSLTWWSASDPAAILSQLDLQCRAQGYVLEEEQEIAQMQMAQRQYRAGDTTRALIGGGAMVTLIEQREG